jgi:hypothetical protein
LFWNETRVDCLQSTWVHPWFLMFCSIFSFLCNRDLEIIEFPLIEFQFNQPCLVGFMVLNATFNNISVILCWSAILVEEARVPGENHRPVASHWQTLSHNVVLILHLTMNRVQMVGLNWWLGFQLSPFDYWISNSNTDTNDKEPP